MPVQQPELRFEPTPTDLVVALLLTLHEHGVERVDLRGRKDAHRALGRALAVIRDADSSAGRLGPLARQCYRDIVSATYEVLDDGVHQLLAFGMAVIWSPDYTLVEFTLTARARALILQDWTWRERVVLRKAAAAWLRWDTAPTAETEEAGNE